MAKQSQATWGGRFESGPAALMLKFSESVSFDRRLAPFDIAGSKAHAAMLAHVGLLTAKERDAIEAGLDEVLASIEADRFPWDERLEDVHMNIEHALTSRVPAAAKLHTARSRNDQVATDMRLFLKHACAVLAGYALTFGLLLVPAGRLGDVRGRRTMFLWGVALFTVASVFCGAAQSGLWRGSARSRRAVVPGVPAGAAARRASRDMQSRTTAARRVKRMAGSVCLAAAVRAEWWGVGARLACGAVSRSACGCAASVDGGSAAWVNGGSAGCVNSGSAG